MVIDIGNSGTSDTQLIAAYVGESSTTMQSKTTVPATPISLSAGSIATFNVTLSWTNSQTYYFKVVPSAGQQALTFEAKAPAA
jgi:hypothetical protein